MKGYTSKTEIQNSLLTDIDASFDEQVERWIEDVEVYIDKMTGRNFIADSTAKDRRYDGDNTSKLLIDDCIEVTEIKIGDTVTNIEDSGDGTGDYVLYPSNQLPYTRIQFLGNIFPSWPPLGIKIKAKWGYSKEVPADIRNIATILVSGIINYSLNAEGEVKSMSIGRYNVTYKDEKQWQDFERVAEVIKYYRKYNL